MKIHRFILDAQDGFPTALTQPDLTHQIARVLRLAPGERITLCNGKGREALMTLESVTPAHVELSLVEERASTAEPARPVTLYLALIKPDAFDLAVEKAVECGVSAVVPVLAERSIKRELKSDRLKRIVREAAEQSGRGTLPAIHAPVPLKDAVAQAAAGTKAFFCLPGAPKLGAISGADPVSVFVGPEGGWTGEEERLALAAGLAPAGLGPTVLRAETAAAVATFLAANA